MVALEGHWWKAKAILKKYKDDTTNPISDNGNTPLHIVIREGHNYFVTELLNFIQDGTLIEKQNSNSETTLHAAAIVDNKELVEILNNASKVLLSTYYKTQLNAFLYLMDVAENGQSHLPSDLELDLALKLVKIDPLLSLATRDDEVLMAISINFPSKLEFWEALMYL
ncbi:ankyrin repeat-containing protein, partial [Tanacetum coccineum]